MWIIPKSSQNKTKACIQKSYKAKKSRKKKSFFFFCVLDVGCMRRENGCFRVGGALQGTTRTVRRREEGVQGLFVCTSHPLNTQSALYCVLQIYTQDVGLECFPEKKSKTGREKERKRGFFFFSAKCLLS